MAEDITSCQSRGKIITISLGGATGSVTFTSDTDATNSVSHVAVGYDPFLPILTLECQANTLWDLFYGGNSSTRPFGTAVLDG